MEPDLGEERHQLILLDDSSGHEEQGQDGVQQPWKIDCLRLQLEASSEQPLLTASKPGWQQAHSQELFLRSQTVLIKLVLPQAAQLGFYFLKEKE